MSEYPNKKYDLEERTSKFGEEVVKLCMGLEQTVVSKPLISQFVRSGTSIGANYMEANGASSRKDFKSKIHICKKEVQETKHWLKMLIMYYPDKDTNIKQLWNEAQELTLIFGKIISSLNSCKEAIQNSTIQNSFEIRN